MEMPVSRPRRWSAVAAAVLAVCAANAIDLRASFPIVIGPGDPSTVATGYRYALFSGPRPKVSNAGRAIATVTEYLNNGYVGDHAIFFDSGGTYPLPALPSPYVTGISAGTLMSSDGHALVVSRVRSSGTPTGGVDYGYRLFRFEPGLTQPAQLDMPAGFFNGNYASMSVLATTSNGAAGGLGYYYINGVQKGYRGIVWPAGTIAGQLRQGPTAALDGNASAQVLALNASGVAVGSAEHYDTNGVDIDQRATRWMANTETGVELDQPALANASWVASSLATSVDAAGDAFGQTIILHSSTVADQRPVRWNAGGTAVTMLGTLGSSSADIVKTARLTAVNAAGTAVGVISKYSSDDTHTYLGDRIVRWNAGTTAATELGLLTTENNGVSNPYTAIRINSLGTIGATCVAPGGASQRPVLWLTGSTTPLDVNTLLPAGLNITLTEFDDVTDTGWVALAGTYDPDGAGPELVRNKIFTMLVPQAGSYGMGDANFDTTVDFADLVVLAQHYNQTNVSQALNVGDFNLDGATNFADLVALAQHYNTSAASVASLGNSSLAADWALAESLVPEPAAMIAVVVSALILSRRKSPTHAAAWQMRA